MKWFLFYSRSLLEASEAFRAKTVMGNSKMDTNLWGNNEEDTQKNIILPHPPGGRLGWWKSLIDFTTHTQITTGHQCNRRGQPVPCITAFFPFSCLIQLFQPFNHVWFLHVYESRFYGRAHDQNTLISVRDTQQRGLSSNPTGSQRGVEHPTSRRLS